MNIQAKTQCSRMLCFETEVLTGLYQLSTTHTKKNFFQSKLCKQNVHFGKILHHAEIMFITDLAKNTIDEPIYDTRK